MKVFGLSLSICLLSAGLSCTALAQTASVPFVGCVSDGQMGLTPAPKPSETPRLPVAMASRLAWYSSGELAALAPRGWHCLGLEGSNGSMLLIVPGDARKYRTGRETAIKGQGIQLSFSYGETSGRFEAAKIAARLFPNRRAFVDDVANEGILPKDMFKRGPFPHDRIRRLGPDQVSFETPANMDGAGTMSRLVKSEDPIQGVAKMDDDNDATQLVVRLNAGLRDLAPTILGMKLP